MVDVEIAKEINVLNTELEFFLHNEIPSVYKLINQHIEIILKNLRGNEPTIVNQPPSTASFNNNSKLSQRINLVANNSDTVKCTLLMNFNELKHIEIFYKPSPRHNNYIYKSKEDSSWFLFQITNAWDILNSIKSNMVCLTSQSLEQAIFNVDRLLDGLNSARNILLFPKKRSISELQSQKNMKNFPLVPNDLVFSFYIQGFKLILAIYTIKGADSTKTLLECSSITWLNNSMILLTNCLQTLQQIKDKLTIFEQLKSS